MSLGDMVPGGGNRDDGVGATAEPYRDHAVYLFKEGTHFRRSPGRWVPRQRSSRWAPECDRGHPIIGLLRLPQVTILEFRCTNLRQDPDL